MPIKARIKRTTIELTQGDITQQDTDAIVNAANSSLLGGGGVDGAIHRAAGPELLAETRTLGGCPTGNARITSGYRLKARHVIHAVGPVYRRGDPQVAELLASAYRRSMEVAVDNEVKTLAFPSISTGVFGYPVAEAAEIALNTAYEFASVNEHLQLIRFVLFDSATYEGYATALARLTERHANVAMLG